MPPFRLKSGFFICMTEKELYKQVFEAAKKAVLNKRLPISFGDLVNDAYLHAIENGMELSINNLRKSVHKEAQKYLNKFSAKQEAEVNSLQSSFCRKCKEDKPVGCFGITIRKKTNKKVVQSYCNECQAAAMREVYRKKNPNSKPVVYHEYPEGASSKDKAAINHARWQKENYHRLAEYKKNRFKDNSKSLADSYIKHLLRRYYASRDITPDMIIKKREEVKLLRWRQGNL